MAKYIKEIRRYCTITTVDETAESELSTTVPYFPTSSFCAICNGECWNRKDNLATQRAVREKFGITPNECVISSTGQVFCPHA